VRGSVDHVDAFQALGGAHEHLIVLDDEVAALDQLDAELVGEEGVLVIGGVVDTRRHQRDRRLARGAVRRDRAQGGEQLVGIALDRRHAMAGEQVRKQPHHDLAVFQHVGHAGRRAGIVLQNDEILVVHPDDVDAGDMDIDVVRDVLAVHLGAEHRVLEDQVFGHDAGAEDIAAVIDIAQEHIQRLDALAQPSLQQRPFLAGEDTRDHIERDQPFLGFGIAIDGEGDADPAEQQLSFLPAIFQSVRRRLLEPSGELTIGHAEVVPGAVHLIKRNRHRTRHLYVCAMRNSA
jgi:hypothetical protein